MPFLALIKQITLGLEVFCCLVNFQPVICSVEYHKQQNKNCKATFCSVILSLHWCLFFSFLHKIMKNNEKQIIHWNARKQQVHIPPACQCSLVPEVHNSDNRVNINGAIFIFQDHFCTKFMLTTTIPCHDFHADTDTHTVISVEILMISHTSSI